MRVIDENGRVFGVVNVVDLLVVLFAAALLVAGYAVVTGAGPSSAGAADSTVNVTVTVKVAGASPPVVDRLEAGVTDRRDGVTHARITSVRTEPTPVLVENESGVFEGEHPWKTDVYVTAVLQVDDTERGYQFDGEPVKVGRNVTLSFPTVEATGRVVDVDAGGVTGDGG